MENNEQQIDTVTNQQPSHHGRSASILAVIIVLVIGAFGFGYASGKQGLVLEPSTFKLVGQNENPTSVDYGLLWKALKVVESKYVDKDNIDQQKVLYGAIQGAVSAAGDEYTEFFDPEELAEFKKDMSGTFSGIGAEVGKRASGIVIIAPLEGAPADRAGLMPNDIIAEVDGQSTVNMSVDQVVNLIRGPAGTDVTLTLIRATRTSPLKVTIKRENIFVKSVKVSYQESNGKNVTTIKISRFGDDTKSLFNLALNEIKDRKVDGVILDLRNNPGGYLDTAVEVASDWLDKGKLVVTEEHSVKNGTQFLSEGYNRLGNIPTMILINGGSASASEIVAGALRDNGKAKLIGEKSFGKGSVQELVELNGNMAVKVTIAKWITPSGQHLNKEGLNPDIEVKMTEEDILNDRDPQMDRALQEILK